MVVTLDYPTRAKPILHRIESSTEERKVLVLDDSYMWNFYVNGLQDIVEKGNIALTQFLGEAQRVAQSKPFDAYVINLDRQRGTEYGLQDGVDLAEKIEESRGSVRELMWLLSRHTMALETAETRGFHRLYEISGEPAKYPNLNKFIGDLRQDLTYGRRGI